MSEAARTSFVSVRQFICRGPSPHRFTALVRTSSALLSGERLPTSSSYQPLGRPASIWQPLPICPTPSCGFLAEQLEFYSPITSAIPESERFVAFISPDGTRICPPGRNDAPMPPRYVRAGYTRFVASSIHDLDRVEQLRSAMTGNDVMSEMHYSEAERARRRESEPDHDREDIGKGDV